MERILGSDQYVSMSAPKADGRIRQLGVEAV